MVSKTIDDFPEPETPVKMVSFRFGMRTETFWRLFSRAPRISMNSSMCLPIDHAGLAAYKSQPQEAVR